MASTCCCLVTKQQVVVCVWLFATSWTAAFQASLSFTVSQSLLKLLFIESVMLSNHLLFCHPLLLLPSIFPRIKVFSDEPALCVRGQSIGASASELVLPMNIHGWFPCCPRDPQEFSIAPQGESIRSSVLSLLHGPAVTCIHDYWKDLSCDCTGLCRTSLLFNTLSRLVTAFLPRSKHLLISWLQSPFIVILEAKKMKSVTVSTFSPSICHEVMGLAAMI